MPFRCTAAVDNSRFAALLATIAMLVSICVVYHCELIVFVSTTGVRATFGPYLYCDHWETCKCVWYRGRVDAAWKLTRLAAVMAMTLGGLLCLLTWMFNPCTLCRLLRKRHWKPVGYAYFLTALFQAAILVAAKQSEACSHKDNVYLKQRQDYDLEFHLDCTLNWGAWLSFFGAMLWWATGMVMVLPVVEPIEAPSGRKTVPAPEPVTETPIGEQQRQGRQRGDERGDHHDDEPV